MSEYKYHPIYLRAEDENKDFDELVEEIRSSITTARGKLYDVGRMFPGWRERVQFAEGGLTCVISALYPGIIEYRKVHKK